MDITRNDEKELQMTINTIYGFSAGVLEKFLFKI